MVTWIYQQKEAIRRLPPPTPQRHNQCIRNHHQQNQEMPLHFQFGVHPCHHQDCLSRDKVPQLLAMRQQHHVRGEFQEECVQHIQDIPPHLIGPHNYLVGLCSQFKEIRYMDSRHMGLHYQSVKYQQDRPHLLHQQQHPYLLHQQDRPHLLHQQHHPYLLHLQDRSHLLHQEDLHSTPHKMHRGKEEEHLVIPSIFKIVKLVCFRSKDNVMELWDKNWDLWMDFLKHTLCLLFRKEDELEKLTSRLWLSFISKKNGESYSFAGKSLTKQESQPHNVNLKIKLLMLYIDTERFQQAYQYAVEVERKCSFPDSVEWYSMLVEAFEAYSERYSQELDINFHILNLSSLDCLVTLTLSEPHLSRRRKNKDDPADIPTINDATAALLQFDQSLKLASKKDLQNGAWMYFLDHMRGQLYFHIGSMIMKKAKRVIGYLLCQKILAPDRISLLGNHEIRSVQDMFTFHRECLNKFGSPLGDEVWQAINQVFDVMPIAEKIFCVHGGILPPWLGKGKIESIKMIPNPLPDPENMSPLAWELMWSDPISHENSEEDMIKFRENEGFVTNMKRGTAHCFSSEALENFLSRNGLSHVVRAHEVQQAGFKLNN